MVALYKISTNTVIQNYGDGIPSFVVLSGVGHVHNPEKDYAIGDYMFIPVIYAGKPPNTPWYTQNGVMEELKIIDGKLTYVITSLFNKKSLSEVKAIHCEMIDTEANKLILKYLNGSSGQVVTYILSYLEAMEIVSNPYANKDSYPWNAAKIGLPGIATIQEAANVTISQMKQFVLMASKIEFVRLAAKNAINSAYSVSNVKLIYDNVSWEIL